MIYTQISDMPANVTIQRATSPETNFLSGKCTYCETMTKNLQHLENYLRSSNGKGSCSSCTTCLSFLLYMRQQVVVQPRFDNTNPTNPASITSEVITVQETIETQLAKTKTMAEKLSELRRGSALAVNSKTAKDLSKSKLAGSSSRYVRTQSAITSLKQRLGISEKKVKKHINTTKKNASKSLSKTSAKAVPKTKSTLSKVSSAAKGKRTKLPSTVSRDSGTKQARSKLKTDVAIKKTKISAAAQSNN